MRNALLRGPVIIAADCTSREHNVVLASSIRTCKPTEKTEHGNSPILPTKPNYTSFPLCVFSKSTRRKISIQAGYIHFSRSLCIIKTSVLQLSGAQLHLFSNWLLQSSYYSIFVEEESPPLK